MTAEHKVLLIGLDAATFDLILPWAAEGKLPHLAEMLAQGSHGPLRSVPNLNSLSAWTTFATGQNPGQHGVFWFYTHKPGSYDLRFLNGGDVHSPRFWEIASDAGRRSIILNVPMTYPARPLNGVLVAGMDAPDESSEGFTYPPELREELLQEGYLIDTNILGYARSGRHEQALAATRQVIERRAATAKRLLQSEPWQLFVVVFTALDRIQHGFWCPGGADVDLSLPPSQVASPAVLEFYQHLDRVIGELRGLAGEGTTTILVSDHGMGFNPLSNMYLNPWLESLGLFSLLAPTAGGMARGAATYLLRRASAIADGIIPKRMRRRIMRLLPGGRAGLVGRLHRVPCDWSQTQAYADYIQPAIWINLRGREPAGIVEPGAEYEELRDLIIAQLSHCRDPQSGAPIVQGVCRREEIYTGPHVAEAPDLHIDWNFDHLVSGFQYEDEAGRQIIVGRAADVVERRNISGDHRPDGIFVAAGPGVQASHELQGAQIADVAPTLLHLLGLPVPQGMDGHVLTDMFDEAYASQHPVRHEDSGTSRAAKEGHEFSDEESRSVEDRLRGLGYLE